MIYALVGKYQTGDYYTRWKFTIYMDGGKEVKWSGFKTQEEAKEKYDAFSAMIQKLNYVIPEQIL